MCFCCVWWKPLESVSLLFEDKKKKTYWRLSYSCEISKQYNRACSAALLWLSWWRSWIPWLFLLSYLLAHDPDRFLPLSRTFDMSYEEAAVKCRLSKKKGITQQHTTAAAESGLSRRVTPPPKTVISSFYQEAVSVLMKVLRLKWKQPA